MMLDRLPVEVLDQIFIRLPLSDRAKLRQVNQRIKTAVELTLQSTNHITGLKDGHYIDMHPCDSWHKFVSISSKDLYDYKAIHPSFWDFINNYCGDWIELHLKNFSSLPCPGKLKFFYLENEPYKELFDLKFIYNCPKLEGCRISSIVRLDEYWCDRLFILGVERSFSHLCMTGIKELKLSSHLKSLDILCDNCLPKGLTNEITNSLTELRIFPSSHILTDGSQFEPISYQFSSLKKLSLFIHRLSDQSTKIFIECFKPNFDQLESLELQIGTNDISDITRIPSLCTNLRQIRISIDFYSDRSNINRLDFVSPHLRRLTIRTMRNKKISVNIMSKKIRYIHLISLALTELNFDPSDLRYFKLQGSVIGFDLFSKIKDAKYLNELHFNDTNFDHATCITIISHLENFNFLRNIHMSILLRRPLPCEIEIELMFAPSTNAIDPIVFTSDHNVNARIIYIDQTGNNNVPNLNMSARRVKIYHRTLSFLQQNRQNILSFLKNYCLDVSVIEFDTRDYILSSPDDSFIDWIKSFTNLTRLKGPFKQEQLNDILSSCYINELEVDLVD